LTYYATKLPSTTIQSQKKTGKKFYVREKVREIDTETKTVRIGTKTVGYEEELEKRLLHCFETNQTIHGLCEVDLVTGMGVLYKIVERI